MKWMVSGGAGYIGSHVVQSLQARGHQVAVLDDLSTGDRARVGADTAWYEGSVLDTDFVVRSLQDHRSDGVVHLAAKKAVEESVADPLTYYHQNVVGMLSLLRAMVRAGTRSILFSSSAAVYGLPESGLVTEESPTTPASPYGTTKLMSEQMLHDVAAAENLNWAALRYFNVAGAVSPTLADRGENNLIPRVFRAVTTGVRPQIFGTDYPTRDGTCIRDYIHVGDVAEAHAAVAERIARDEMSATFNIGTGTGTSVLEVMLATKRVTGIDFAWDERPRRAGDPAEVIADATKIRTELGWQASHDLDSIIASAWQAWQG
jgi:UDP-glucose 4-epimerase